MPKFIQPAVIFIFITISAYAQETVNAGGGNAESENFTVSFSVGQVFYSDNEGINLYVNEGVQQVYKVEIVFLQDEKNSNYFVYPNPAGESINLIAEVDGSTKLYYSLYNVEGKLLLQDVISSEQVQIDLTSFSSSTYLLKIFSESGTIQIFRIVKKQ